MGKKAHTPTHTFSNNPPHQSPPLLYPSKLLFYYLQLKTAWKASKKLGKRERGGVGKGVFTVYRV